MEDKAPTTALAVEIIANYVSNNDVAIDQLPDLIRTVHRALERLGEPELESHPEAAKPTAAQIRKSIRPDALISFVDGRPYKTLKRHLAKHELTIDQYKQKFGLSKDYPSTAPEYSAKRSQMAKTAGLGRQALTAAPEPVEAPVAKPAAKRTPKKTKAP